MNAIEALFRFAKPNLTSFDLELEMCLDVENLPELGKTLQALGSRVAHSFKLRFSGTVMKKGAFEEFVRGTPLLEEVSVRLSARVGLVENIAQTFTQCPDLSSLRISSLTSDIQLKRVANKWFFSRLRAGRRVDIQ